MQLKPGESLAKWRGALVLQLGHSSTSLDGKCVHALAWPMVLDGLKRPVQVEEQLSTVGNDLVRD